MVTNSNNNAACNADNSYFKVLSNGEVDRLSRWNEKWKTQYNGKPGFHLEEVNPNLDMFYGNKFNPPKNAPILLPLCGKTLDLKWLSKKHRGCIIGVEGIKLAIEELRNESLTSLRQLHAGKNEKEDGLVWTTAKDDNEWFINEECDDENDNNDKGIISVMCTDFFELSPSLFGSRQKQQSPSQPPFGAVFDRGSLVAIPPFSRGDYIKKIDSMLKFGGQILLVTLDKHENRDEGPPFSLSPEDVNALFDPYKYYEVSLVHEHESEVKSIKSTEYVFIVTKKEDRK